MKHLSLCLLALLLLVSTASGQRRQRSQGAEQLYLVDRPSGATLQRGSFSLGLRIYENGGLLTSLGVGITPRFMIGLSFGGENFIGSGGVNWNSQPGIMARIRVIDEGIVMPVITIGFDSQGYGRHDEDFNRYAIKSPGFYAAATKNFKFIFDIGIHGGTNYSLETDDDDKDLNFWLGADVSFNREFRVMAEYDYAFNDNKTPEMFGTGDGYLNAAVQWSFSDRFFIQFDLLNLLKGGFDESGRQIKIVYFEYF